MVYEAIIANKELLKIVYAVVITFICALIVLRTDRLFKISDYQGLRYFRNAFFFYGIAFTVRFIIGARHEEISQLWCDIIKLSFEFTIVTAGFLLLYSLVWKKVEKERNFHSLLNKNMFVIYAVSFLIALLDVLWDENIFMYVSQIVLFAILITISYKNFKSAGKESPFLKYYFITMILGFIAWVLNTILHYYLNWDTRIQILVYALNGLFFLLFLHGALHIAKQNQHGKKKRKA